VADHQPDPVALDGGDQPVCIFQRDGERLLDNQMLASVSRDDSLLGVEPGRRSDVDGIDVGAGAQVLDPLVRFRDAVARAEALQGERIGIRRATIDSLGWRRIAGTVLTAANPRPTMPNRRTGPPESRETTTTPSRSTQTVHSAIGQDEQD